MSKKIFKILFYSCLIGLSLNANELIKKPNSPIIDIGYTQPQKSYSPTISPDWVYYSTLTRVTDKLIQTGERILSEKYDCETDYLGRENCSIQQVDCNANLQQDDGISILTKKTHTIKASKSNVGKNNCSASSTRGCENTQPYFMTGCQWGWHLALNWKGCGYSYTQHPHHWTNYGYFGDDKARMLATLKSIKGGNIRNSQTYKPYSTCLTYDTYAFTCPSDYKVKKIGSMNFVCEKEYSYYQYKCKTDTNNYDRPWIGPVKDAGGDCQGQCGPYGCVCNSATPPKNNCVRDTYICPFNESQLCTITTDDKSGIDNILNGYVYEAGNAQTFKNTVEKDKTCPNGLTWNKVKDICEDDVKLECLKSGFYYDNNLKECIKPIECKGTIDENGKCMENAKSKCDVGYTFDNTSNMCISNPLCDRGVFSKTTGLCEEQIYCPSGFSFNISKTRCEKTITYEPLTCDVGTLKNGTPKYCQTNVTTVDGKLTCPKNFSLSGTICKKELMCPSGYLKDSTKNACVKIESGIELNFAENLYIKEFDCIGGLSKDGICSSLSTCKGTGLLDIENNRCVILPDLSCSEEITAKCAEGSFYKDGKCLEIPVCPSGTNYDYDRNICTLEGSCEEGYTKNGSKCEKTVDSISYSCLAGEVLYEGDVDVCRVVKNDTCPAGYKASLNASYCERSIVCPSEYPNIDYKNNKCYKGE